MGICLILGSGLNSWPADEISLEQIQAEDETVQSEIHNFINTIWSKEDSSLYSRRNLLMYQLKEGQQ
jgi:hypothetical protein